jgi:hypothetical protein
VASLLSSAKGDRNVFGGLPILLYYLTTKSGLWTLMIHSITYISFISVQFWGKPSNVWKVHEYSI